MEMNLNISDIYEQIRGGNQYVVEDQLIWARLRIQSVLPPRHKAQGTEGGRGWGFSWYVTFLMIFTFLPCVKIIWLWRICLPWLNHLLCVRLWNSYGCISHLTEILRCCERWKHWENSTLFKLQNETISSGHSFNIAHRQTRSTGDQEQREVLWC